ncbi:DeoR family transcriptional regulator [Dactylosporangium sp. NPDC049525]|uniref:DeoR family transcriptional regulator n=1 Tax=Dactylosporangium sp. NPDC049525 TaxID=3154730 RepID=UPI00341CCBA7
MLSDLRRAQILADAREQGGVSLRELSHRFEVSIPTIRRDLSALADQGLVRRVHGGAVAVRADVRTAVRTEVRTALRAVAPHQVRGSSRTAILVAEPVITPPTDGDVYVARRVAGLSEAAALVTPGMAIGVSGGAAAIGLAGLLDDVRGLTVVTPVPAVAAAVVNRATVVVLVGGVRTPSGSHAGPLTQATLAQLNLDLAFVELRDPATTGDALAAQTDLALIQRATAAVFLQPATGSRPRSG